MCAYLPFVFLTIATVMLLDLIRARQRKIRTTFVNFQEKLNMMRVKKLVAGAVVWCMITSFPSATARLFYSSLITSKYGQLTLQIADSWIFTTISLNFFLLLASNKLFRSEAKKMFIFLF